MADSQQMRRLLGYNQWADERILSAIEGLSAADLAQPREAYFGSLRKQLSHVLNAQRLWLARWKGQPPPSLDEEATLPWREAFAVSHRALEEYLAPLGDADFDRVVEYKNTRGEPFALPLGQLVTHLVNHGTAHRAELGLLLERIGRSPGDLDYFLYFRRLPPGA